MTHPEFASTERHPKLPDLDNWRVATWMTDLYEGLDYPAAAPWCASAHLGWCLRQADRAGIDRAVLADFCAVPVDLIHRFSEGGYASEAQTPSGIVGGLRTLMEEAVRPVGPALEQAWNVRLCSAGIDNDYARSISQKIQIKASVSKFQASASGILPVAASQNRSASEPS